MALPVACFSMLVISLVRTLLWQQYVMWIKFAVWHLDCLIMAVHHQVGLGIQHEPKP